MTANSALNTYPSQRTSAKIRDSVGYWVVPLLLVFALFQNYSDIQSVMSGESLKLYQVQGSLAIRAMKDISYLFIIIALFYYNFKEKSASISMSFTLLLGLSIILAAISIGKHDLLTAVLGLRWVTPLLIFILLKDWALRYQGARAIPWVFAGMLICVGVQIYQLFNMPPVYGTIFGLSARTPGIFLAPNSASFFGCACAAFISVYSGGRFKYNASAGALAFMISALAQSGTGIVVSLFLLLQIFLRRSQVVLFGAIGVAMIWVAPNLDTLLSRDRFTELSGGGRIDRFTEIVSEAAFSLNNFGFYTNAANLADELPQYRKAVDSLIASFVGNFGATTALALAIVILFIFQYFKSIKFSTVSATLVVFVIFSFTTIIFEAYPMNILLALSFWGARNMSIARNHKTHA